MSHKDEQKSKENKESLLRIFIKKSQERINEVLIIVYIP